MNRRSLLKMLAGVPFLGGWLLRPTTVRVPEWDADVEVKPLGPAEFDNVLAQMEEHRRATGRRMLEDREVIVPVHMLKPAHNRDGSITVELKLDTEKFDQELERAIRRVLGQGRVKTCGS